MVFSGFELSLSNSPSYSSVALRFNGIILEIFVVIGSAPCFGGLTSSLSSTATRYNSPLGQMAVCFGQVTFHDVNLLVSMNSEHEVDHYRLYGIIAWPLPSLVFA